MRRPARALASGALLIAAVLGFLIYQGISNNLVYYITPSELLAKGVTADGQDFRIGGLVKKGTVHYNVKTRLLRFVLTDEKRSVRVQSHGLPPETFQPGIGAVVEGKFTGTRFNATNLMIKHDGTYIAPKPGQKPKPDNYILKSSK